MMKLKLEQVLRLHELMAEATGGAVGVRDMGLLESAVENAYATFGGVELHPSVEEKAASIGFSLIANHAFLDGNKRIGVFVMLTFLEVAGVKLSLTNEDVIDFGLAVASGKMKSDDVPDWILSHKVAA